MRALDPQEYIQQYGFDGLKLQIQGERCRRDLLEFVKKFWPVNDRNTPLVTGWCLEALCDHLMAVTDGHIKRLLINISPGTMKALPVNTPIPTPHGWKRHGDLGYGDFVFGVDGIPKAVHGATQKREEACFKVTFDDGSSLVTGEGHEWWIERDLPNQGPQKRGFWARVGMVVKTPELQPAKLGAGRRAADRIPIAKAVERDVADLEIDPYLLGAWLGDGDARAPTICCGDQDLHHFVKLGRQVVGTKTAHRISIDGLRPRLHALALMNNKHLPDEYLEASIEQRWEVVRGLMDTDGDVSERRAGTATCRFTAVNDRIMTAMTDLLSSLGIKHRRRGIRLRFTPPLGAVVFKLRRKQEILDARLVAPRQSRIGYRYVVSVELAPPQIVNCISVEGQLYLASRDHVVTKNSLITGVFFPAWEWGPMNRPWYRYICASYSQHLTKRDNRRFLRVVNDNDYFRLWGHNFFLEQTGQIQIINSKTGWKLATSVQGVGGGERGNRIIIDDANNPNDVESETVRDATRFWLREVMPDRLNSLDDDVIICIQQRVHEQDATGTLLEMAGLDYVHLQIPAEYDSSRHCITVLERFEDGTPKRTWEDPRGLDDNGERLPGFIVKDQETGKGPTPVCTGVIPRSPAASKDGELFWPERISRDAMLKQKIAKGPIGYAQQYNQLVNPRGGGIIKREWWMLWAKELFPDLVLVVGSLDTAFKEGEQNDYNALTIWGVFLGDQGEPLVILKDAWRDRMGLSELAERVGNTCNRHKVDYLLIEDKARGHDTAAELRKQFGDRRWRTMLLDPSKLGGDKVARLQACQPIFSGDAVEERDAEGRFTGKTTWTGGLVYAPDKQYAEDVMDEVQRFPRGAHDDYVDTVSQFFLWARKWGEVKRRVEHLSDVKAQNAARPRVSILYDV